MIYPIYKRARKSLYSTDRFVGTVVMFTGPTVGTVIAVPHANAVWKVGYQTDSWINHDDDSSWEDMKPSDEFFKMVSRQLFELPSDVPSIFD